jgi:hypothetical protein
MATLPAKSRSSQNRKTTKRPTKKIIPISGAIERLARIAAFDM